MCFFSCCFVAMIPDLDLLSKRAQYLRLGIKEIRHRWYRTQLRMSNYLSCFLKQTHINQFQINTMPTGSLSPTKLHHKWRMNKWGMKWRMKMNKRRMNKGQPQWRTNITNVIQMSFLSKWRPHPSCSGKSTITLEQKSLSSMPYISEERLQTEISLIILEQWFETTNVLRIIRCLQFTYSTTHGAANYVFSSKQRIP